MAEIQVMPEITIAAEDWMWNDYLGAWVAETERVCVLTLGMQYRMITDSINVYEPSEACDLTALLGAPVTAIGDLRLAGLPDNGSYYTIGDTGRGNIFVVTNCSEAYPPSAVRFRLTMEQDQNGLRILLPAQPLNITFEDGYEDGYGQCMYTPAPFVPVSGETYLAEMDGTRHTITCIDQEGRLVIAHLVADETGALSDGTFAITYIPSEIMGADTDGMAVEIIDSTRPQTPVLAVFQALPAGILLKDHTGTAVEHALPERLRVDLSNGGTTDFIHESLVAEQVQVTAEPDFSGGDMVLQPGVGQAFSKVTVQVPENLAPENIAEGVDIAGIIGTLAVGGGGGGTVVCQYDTFTATGNGAVIQHNLGVVPDFALVAAGASVNSGNFIFTYSFSKKLYNASADARSFFRTSVVGATMTDVDNCLDGQDSTGRGSISKADAVSMSVGGSLVKMQASTKYYWVAIGGLS